ncbi:SH3 domain-containing kinase-binding protein 1 [Cololabis saira]|uniref:SH3 domain-containing kinase-binding protein 1 n=1 Tax=Cololabis saira TaxID=129043 RepID=UPI002AD3F9A2|nr:SH3 domain-containing kinase-binding protein 1 [Cololabis saira]XP_061595545.1 SH3 domain-containing kinase-binding protein 1 [Cololabis saira]XP_061595546.1 SH3 domain-containing kinase-binding protein 1 [Cololabis saira]
MEEERNENRSEAINSSSHQENTQEASRTISAMQAVEANSVPTQSLPSLLPEVLSAVLHPDVPPGPTSDPPGPPQAPPGPTSALQPSRDPDKNAPPNLKRLQTELRDLRDQLEQMKSQHNKEIKLLMNELDEEKRIRLTLQMEIQRIKKHMSK